ncbi:hypothetical protein B0H17DRAFT_1034598 [Mycena rosella]|uniref:Secreted protein n=1 Tax=Mycena rosella TaxID=1033263 RepID=A0AAD7GWQ8_MYCRO|nr:hypothetical protein B0H17DRAFT_1034598 [Mycena rosella]
MHRGGHLVLILPELCPLVSRVAAAPRRANSFCAQELLSRFFAESLRESSTRGCTKIQGLANPLLGPTWRHSALRCQYAPAITSLSDHLIILDGSSCESTTPGVESKRTPPSTALGSTRREANRAKT